MVRKNLQKRRFLFLRKLLRSGDVIEFNENRHYGARTVTNTELANEITRALRCPVGVVESRGGRVAWCWDVKSCSRTKTALHLRGRGTGAGCCQCCERRFVADMPDPQISLTSNYRWLPCDNTGVNGGDRVYAFRPLQHFSIAVHAAAH